MRSNLQKLETQNREWPESKWTQFSGVLNCDENTKKFLTKFVKSRDYYIQHFIHEIITFYFI